MTDNAPRPYSSADNSSQGYPSQGQAGTDPGRTLGIVGLILGIVGFFIAFLAPIAGLIVSIIGRNRSKRAGHKNGLATAGIIISIIALIVNIIVAIVFITSLIALGTAAVDGLEQCQNDPNGTVEVGGQEIPCSEILEGAN